MADTSHIPDRSDARTLLDGLPARLRRVFGQNDTPPGSATDRPTVSPPGRHIRSIAQIAWRRPDIIMASLCINLFTLALPIVMLQSYDRVIPNAAMETFTLLMVGLAVVVVLDGMLRMARSWIAAWSAARFEHSVGCRVFNRVTSSELAAFGEDATGTQLDRVTAVDNLRDFYSGQGLIAAIDLPFIFLFLGILAMIGGWLVVVPLAIILAGSWLALGIGRDLRAALERRTSIDRRRYNFIIEVLGGIQTVKGLALEPQMVRRYERLQESSAGAGLDVTWYSAIAQALGGLMGHATMFSTAAAGALLVIGGDMTMGMLAACTLLAGRAVQPLLKGVAMWTQLQTVNFAEQRLGEALELPMESAARGCGEIVECRGALAFRNVSFSWPDGAQPILTRASLEIAPGEMVAISGANGCGKSTLAALAAGLVLPDSGQITLDGVNIAAVSPDDLRRHIAIINQRTTLFRGTLLDNLTMFRADEYLDEAIRLCARLKLDRVFAHLPDGLETQIMDDAADGLPNGVRQRIGVVRALVRQPKVVLFDEANGGLDKESDAAMLELMQSLAGERTVLLISHRPSWLRAAGRRYRLENGSLLPVQQDDKPAAPGTKDPMARGVA